MPKKAKRVFEGVIYDVYHWEQQMFDGSYETFEMLKRPDTVKVIAVKDDRIVILDQEQPDQEPFIDIPGGRHDDEAESELDAVQRELHEETGMIFNNWKLLEVTQPLAKIEQFVYVFLAYNFDQQGEQRLDNGEKITVELMTLDQVKALTNSPKARYLPKDIFESVETINELLELPEYS